MSMNYIGNFGINIEAYDDIINDLLNGVGDVPGFYAIYGPDINVASNTPDGQMLNIFAESKLDILNLEVDNFNSKDPDQAVGVALYAAGVYSGITLKGGTYTIIAVDVVVSASVTLVGLDNTAATPFTIADANGNQFNLITTASLTAGSTSCYFQAANIGNVQVLPNTVNTIVTLILGVTSVNNPSTPYVQGVDQETDSQFRIRRQISTSLPAQGAIEGLQGALNQICTQALVFENNTASNPDGNGIPAHGIWCICNGGLAADIAEAIYNYKSDGSPMYGGQSVVITQVNGTTITIKYDVTVPQNLYLQLSVASKTGASINATNLKAAIVNGLNLGINEIADISTISAIVTAYNPDLVIFSAGVSLTAGSYQEFVAPTLYKNILTLSTANISIV